MAKYSITIFSILAGIILVLPFGYGQAPCPVLEDEVFHQVYDCDDYADVCFPIALEDIISGDLEITVNGGAYQEGYTGCDFDSIIFYIYVGLLGGGEAGPYHLDTWFINGVNHTGEFQDIPSLIDSMNIWDPTGGWVQNSADSYILGGDLNNTYSNMVIEQLLLPGTYSTLGLNYNQDALGTSLDFPVGIHEVIINNPEQDCADTTIVTVACTPIAYIDEATFLGLSGTICLEDSDLLGNIESISPCGEDDSNGGPVDFYINPDNYCVTYSGMNLGTETACFVVCDDMGLCDTTYITINVMMPSEEEVVATILVGQTGSDCLSADNLTGTDFVVYNDCPNESGENVEFQFGNESLCIEYTGLNVGVDTGCIVVCDGLGGCDSMTFYIAVIDPILTNPVAVPDSDTTLQNETIMMDVVANDTVEFVSSLTIFSEPSNGSVFVTMDNQISYEPDEDFCGTDVFEYLVCNNTGCDTTTAQVIVVCDDVKVYNGFSPNQDGINDKFRIGGIEAYPNCSVSIFNAWGNLVYSGGEGEGYSNENGWDGTWGGKHLPDGNYFYMIELNDGSGKKLSGYVLLHR